ncbi:MAG: hypothetical protein JSR59_14460 [Proteobacteria bacterium]|nr:hypothetical protein [Pseudomonadota bacterium]
MLVRNGDRIVHRFATRAVVELLAALLLKPARSHPRDELAAQIWPDADADAGRNRLRNALSHLKAVFGDARAGAAGVIVADRYDVRLNLEAVVCDVMAFEDHVRHGRRAAAHDVYRGDLLPGYRADWLHDERLRLSALYERLGDDRLGPAADAAGQAARIRPQTAVHGDRVRYRLPSYLTALFGREREIQELTAAIEAHRVVTVTGMGGAGKTRLCVETARRQRRFDLACLVRLESCDDAGLIADQIREALGLRAGATSVMRQLAASMDGQRVLLVLDGFEQLVGDIARKTLAALLDGVPGMHLLVSSQVAVRLPGEHEVRLAPLPLPNVDVGVQAAIDQPAIALFLDRARQVRADFNIHARNVAHVVALCRAAEGLPLIIELAAARLRSVPARQISAALTGDWTELKRARSAGRHASLMRVIEWSLALLQPEQHAFLAALSVLRGDWTERDAGEITGAAAADCRRHLADLAEVSVLVTVEGADGVLRFRLPRHVADVVATRTTMAEIAAWRAAHRRCFVARAVGCADERRLLAESDMANCTRALETAVDDGDWSAAAPLALAMGDCWNARGLSEEASGLLLKVAAMAREQRTDASRVTGLAARLLVLTGAVSEARGLADQALRSAVDPLDRVDALLARVNVVWRVDRDGAPLLADANEALAIARAASADELVVRALLQLGALTLSHRQDAPGATAYFAEAEQISLRTADSVGVVSALSGMAACLIEQRRYADAQMVAERGLLQAEGLGHVDLQMLMLNRLGLSSEGLRRYRQALDIFERQTVVARSHGMVYHLAYGIWNQCMPLVRLRRFRQAAMLMAFSKRYWLEHFGAMQPADQASLREIRRKVVERTSRSEWRRCWAQGWGLSLPQALALVGSARD